MCVMAAFLAFIAMLCQLLEFARLRLEFGRGGDGDEPSVFLTDQAPPESRYAYSPAKFPPHPQSLASDRKPAYANRYNSNSGRTAASRGYESSLVEPRQPDTVFAVSGAGELYINRLAEYDDERSGDYRSANERQYGRGGGTLNSNTTNNNRSLARSANNEYSARNQNGDAADSRRRPGNGHAPVVNGTQQRPKPTEHPVLPEYVPKSSKPSQDESTCRNRPNPLRMRRMRGSWRKIRASTVQTLTTLHAKVKNLKRKDPPRPRAKITSTTKRARAPLKTLTMKASTSIAPLARRSPRKVTSIGTVTKNPLTTVVADPRPNQNPNIAVSHVT
ncbi:hypothetical protein EGW08_021495 [Elysia chlorotica]|uniref:Uncharacterized protein n=1 Tax=Elysia chlorotica TaxID=188477 RepID=A0A433SNC9_ELYCH|nr:hypothetical protein EGW08_021495 [Elysia chlorotica]